MDHNERQQLNENEQQLLAREIAIDKNGYRYYGREAFTAGWDAAMEWAHEQVNKIEQEVTEGKFSVKT